MNTKEKTRLLGKVIGSFQAGYIDILVGYSLGQLNGGVTMRVKSVKLPPDCRMPNSIVTLTMMGNEIVSIEKMTKS